MVVGMLYQPTIFYYPAVLVAFVTVALKVLKKEYKRRDKTCWFNSITIVLQLLAVFVHGPSVRSLSKSMTEAESRCESSLQVETTYNALVVISMLFDIISAINIAFLILTIIELELKLKKY